MAIVHTYGKSDIFLTMTCNPNWEEISNELFPGQTAQDRPDLVARVFHGKLEAMKEMLFKKHILGVVVAIKVVKYLYKYVYKGHDRASFSIDQPDADGNIDEIKRYVDARWVTPPEVMWRIFGFPLCANSPSVLQFPLPLPNMHMVAFNEQVDLTNVVASENASKSMLTEYFTANQDHQWARNILYKDFPGSFTWQKGKKYWRPRVERYQIGQIVFTNPAEGERYYLHVLLNHVAGKTSFEDLLTVDGRLCGSFREAAERLGLIEAENTLDDCLTESMGKDIADFALPSIDNAFDPIGGEARQRLAYDEILDAVEQGDGGVSFVDGPGGTGKTFLYRALLAKLHQAEWDHQATEDGLTDTMDEATMSKRQVVEALDNSMRDIMGRRDRPFGGKTIVFGRDFRQLRLVTNMRAHNDTWFADYLLRVGNGTEEANDQGNIRLPEDICVPSTGEADDLEKLIDHVFPSLDDNMSDLNYMTSRAILSTMNDNIDKINIRMVERFRGEEVIYHSFDSAEDNPYGYYAPEFLNGLTPNGLPLHALKLKLNCNIILLRNFDPANGLCNGTRLVTLALQDPFCQGRWVPREAILAFLGTPIGLVHPEPACRARSRAGRGGALAFMEPQICGFAALPARSGLEPGRRSPVSSSGYG
ncbi:uncharacterized protein [Aegilops tauschii subsp. strangulata]|uniref:uncharacterized protein n=1 Tax=Aegilops tauschii subsp. strangulata TaxID=200361 RepID=UPI00098B4BE9|nr:uncharacterized protein LOC109780404 [Aegilops tauschii subsp. strangulata]